MIARRVYAARVKAWWAVGGVAGVLALLAASCTAAQYDRIRLGDGPRALEAALPAAGTHTASIGRLHLAKTAERTEAIIVLLDERREVIGKIYLVDDQRGWRPPGTDRYALRCELDTKRYGVQDVRPSDTLRALAIDLSDVRGDPAAAEAAGRAIAALLHILDVWPGVDPPKLDHEPATLFGRHIPGSGSLTLQLAAGGRLRVEYRVPAPGDG